MWGLGWEHSWRGESLGVRTKVSYSEAVWPWANCPLCLMFLICKMQDGVTGLL